MKVTVPQPCDADWDKMTPQQQGRFCSSCQTCVVDFTVFTDKELIDYLKNTKGKICGNFEDSQLGRNLQYVTPYRKSWSVYKWAAGLALFAGISQTANAHINAKPAIEWVENQHNAPAFMQAGFIDEPVAKDSRVRYMRFLVYKDKDYKKPYNGELKIEVRLNSRFNDPNAVVTFQSAENANEYLLKIPEELVDSSLFITCHAGKNKWYSYFDKEGFAIDTTITPFILNGDMGVTTSIAVYNRYTKHGWEKLLFWKKKKRVFGAIGCPSF